MELRLGLFIEIKEKKKHKSYFYSLKSRCL